MTDMPNMALKEKKRRKVRLYGHERNEMLFLQHLAEQLYVLVHAKYM